MSIEAVRDKAEALESRMGASEPVWNMEVKPTRWNRIALRSISPDGQPPKVYIVGEVAFKILNLMVRGLSNKEIAVMTGRSYGTVKNLQRKLDNKFNACGGKASLIAKLVEEGILFFEPRVPENKWLGLGEPSRTTP